MASKLMNATLIVSLFAVLITVGAAWTLNVDAEDPLDRDYEVGPYTVEEGQTMTIDLASHVMKHSVGIYDEMPSVLNIDDGTLPAWIDVTSSGDVLTLTIAPVAPANVDCRIALDMVGGAGNHESSHTIRFTVNAVAADGDHTGTVSFDANGGIADYSQLTYTAGQAIALPGANAAGKFFTGWYADDGSKLGNAGDVIVPEDGQTVTAQWEDDPDYGYIILRIEEENGEELFCSVDDEEELVAVYDRFMELLFDEETDEQEGE